jgi:hypothetical protein
VTVMRQPLAYQRKTISDDDTSKLDEQPLSSVREDLYFQLDHKAPLLLDAG